MVHLSWLLTYGSSVVAFWIMAYLSSLIAQSVSGGGLSLVDRLDVGLGLTVWLQHFPLYAFGFCPSVAFGYLLLA